MRRGIKRHLDTALRIEVFLQPGDKLASRLEAVLRSLRGACPKCVLGTRLQEDELVISFDGRRITIQNAQLLTRQVVGKSYRIEALTRWVLKFELSVSLSAAEWTKRKTRLNELPEVVWDQVSYDPATNQLTVMLRFSPTSKFLDRLSEALTG